MQSSVDFNQYLIVMSLNKDQSTEAAVFLTLYKEAISTLQESAARDSANEIIDTFTDKIIRISNSQAFRKICDPKQSMISQQKDERSRELVRDVRSFQFSHYMFLKYLPQLLSFPGSSQELVQYMRTQNSLLAKDIGN